MPNLPDFFAFLFFFLVLHEHADLLLLVLAVEARVSKGSQELVQILVGETAYGGVGEFHVVDRLPVCLGR